MFTTLVNEGIGLERIGEPEKYAAHLVGRDVAAEALHAPVVGGRRNGGEGNEGDGEIDPVCSLKQIDLLNSRRVKIAVRACLALIDAGSPAPSALGKCSEILGRGLTYVTYLCSSKARRMDSRTQHISKMIQ